MKSRNFVIAFIGIALVSAVVIGQTQAPPQTQIPADAKGPLSMIFGPV
jgi:hypothetical protein